MFSKITYLLGILLWVTSIVAHGFLDGWVADNVSYSGFRFYDTIHNITAAWSNEQIYYAFVGYDPAEQYPARWTLNSEDIACSKGGKPGQISAVVKAGETITFAWGSRFEHIGPFLTYLANCNGPCETVNPQQLEFFKIHEVGLVNKTVEFNVSYTLYGDTEPRYTNNYGKWANEVSGNPTKIEVRIPKTLAPGNYTVRHEVIALHLAVSFRQIQSYPQCVNFIVTGNGTLNPKGIKGTKLYNSKEPGFNYNPYPQNVTEMPDYLIPGPKVWDGK